MTSHWKVKENNPKEAWSQKDTISTSQPWIEYKFLAQKKTSNANIDKNLPNNNENDEPSSRQNPTNITRNSGH